MGEGFFVQSVTGVHSGVNPVSGDFSVGAEGLMIRGGVLAEPVREGTIASTLQRMLQEIVHVGRDVEWLPGLAAGQTLAVDGMVLSGPERAATSAAPVGVRAYEAAAEEPVFPAEVSDFGLGVSLFGIGLFSADEAEEESDADVFSFDESDELAAVSFEDFDSLLDDRLSFL